MNNLKEIRNILKDALNIERWAPKTDTTYSFIDDNELEEMIDNIIKELKTRGYKIIKNGNINR
jgi:hypothetical protein